jgi:N-acetylglucosaminyldiphosphoundecaprenol N-acetyl-beta-D-mannosaminyltransferase
VFIRGSTIELCDSLVRNDFQEDMSGFDGNTRPPISILGIPFDNVSFDEAIKVIENMIASKKPHYIATANVDFLVQSLHDAELRRILCEAHLVLCDGAPVLWASRLFGNPLIERVAGSDLVPQLLERAVQNRYRIFFLGGTPDVSERAVSNLRTIYPGIDIVGFLSPPFSAVLEMNHQEIRRLIQEAQPDLLFVSFSCPKSEKWLYMNYLDLGVPVGIGIGATIDFAAGRFKRAPAWMRKAGLEWFYRFVQEPKRLFKRYSKDLCYFTYAIIRQWFYIKCFSKSKHPWVKSTVHSHEPQIEIQVEDVLDVESIRQNAELWKRCLEKESKCIFDLTKIQTIDSSGVGFLVWLHKKMKRENGRLVLLSPSQSVLKVLDVFHLTSLFLISPDLEGARRMLRVKDEESVVLLLQRGIASILWQGDITAKCVSRITQFLERQIELLQQSELSVDLSRVQFLDSSGLGMMVRLKKFASSLGVRLRFLNAPSEVRNVLQLTKLETYLLDSL